MFVFSFATYSCSDEYRSFSQSEILQRLLALVLGPIAMDGLSWESLVIQELLELLCPLLRLHKHESERVRTFNQNKYNNQKTIQQSNFSLADDGHVSPA